ncbi:MAG TPA: DUF4233 domain-containing protein [Nocardiopsis listeri]|uniref:DUF4233 domain-containing protein n=1 Tax=Nocardiopsis listeri TaxID=53440 RepID=UPI001DFCB667|nr:DUF4233 domain-containing protein [Nocardiopsis listeri]HJE58598.1 DUF4233 domain-containing protein [Nocardiopsis listeri]
MRTVCAVVLVFEAIVIGLAIPIAVQLEGVDPSIAGGVWGGMAVAALLLSGLQKHTWAHYAAWALQAAFLFSSFMVSGALLVAIVFVSLWVTAVILGRRVDETRAVHAARAGSVEGEDASGGGDVTTASSGPQTR